MKKHQIITDMVAVVCVTVLLLTQVSCDNNTDDNETSTTTTTVAGSPDDLSCVPCGDFDPRCPNCDITECPVCVSLTSEGNLKYGYGDGHYAISEIDENDPDTTTFYDSGDNRCFQYVVFENVPYETTVQTYDNTGQECYRWVSQDSAGTVTWTVDGEQYVIHAEDGRWDCPDGTTWQAPPGCEDWDFEATVVPLPGTDENCKPVTDLCS